MSDFNENGKNGLFSKRIKAGKKRTYFIDVRSTKNNDYYLTITESKRKMGEGNKFIKHKIFLYKEDFNKFVDGLNEAVDHVKTELLPEFDFEKFDNDKDDFQESDNKSDTNRKDEGDPFNLESTGDYKADLDIDFNLPKED